ncbi:hypothetical protein ACTXM3_08595 [Glutamicibacter arilaitensis]|uniref:hypothetical protein n=1 Tax=Glutamicibacter arilaitensis TaxID=256701 RepID=UPI003FD4B5F6
MKSPAFVTKKSLKVPTILAVGLLFLSGCSDNGSAMPSSSPDTANASNPPMGQVYQFDEVRVADSDDQVPFSTSDMPVTVQMSEELKGAAPSGVAIAVEKYTVDAKAFSTGICRANVGIEYTAGGKGIIDGTETKFGSNDYENLVNSLFVSETFARAVEVVDELPTDDELKEDAAYITKDATTATFVKSCGEDGDDYMFLLVFPYSGEDGDLESFATAWPAFVGFAGSNSVQLVIEGNAEADVSPTGAWVASE